tara:strand:- start:243 stop:395 length:153 start_codon:yes stop_codon:yes gene_type:complete
MNESDKVPFKQGKGLERDIYEDNQMHRIGWVKRQKDEVPVQATGIKAANT